MNLLRVGASTIAPPLATQRSKVEDYLSGFHPRSQVCLNGFIIGFVIRNLHREGVHFLTWDMNHIEPPRVYRRHVSVSVGSAISPPDLA